MAVGVPRGDEYRITFDGGIEELERLSLITPASKPSLDVIIVSVDLETSRSKGSNLRVNRKGVSGVREVGFAVLDTRVMFPSLPKPQPPMISTQQLSTSHASEYFEDCNTTDFRVYLSRTRYITKENLNDTIARNLQFPDDTIGLRTVVTIGHSPERDLEIIRRLGISINRIAPIVAIIDTYRLSKYILGSDSPLKKYTPLQTFALSNVLTDLGILYGWYDLHNAGNDATYTLYALIMLAARWSEYKGRTAAAAELRAFVESEAAASRWRPVRKALGAHRTEEVKDPVIRLVSRSVAVAKPMRLSSSEDKKKIVKPHQ